MKYQSTGLQASLIIHTAVFLSIFGMSRLVSTPSPPIPLELGLLSGSVSSPKKLPQEKAVQRIQKRETSTMSPAKETAEVAPLQQRIPSSVETPESRVPSQESSSPSAVTEASKAGETKSDSNGPEVIGPVYDASYLNNPKPQYPPAARRMRLEGTVIVQALVNQAGKPEIVRLGKSSGASVLDHAALNAVQSWSFIPARQGSNPVPAWVDIPLRFHLI